VNWEEKKAEGDGETEHCCCGGNKKEKKHWLNIGKFE
jgi:hypothetical protein